MTATAATRNTMLSAEIVPDIGLFANCASDAAGS